MKQKKHQGLLQAAPNHRGRGRHGDAQWRQPQDQQEKDCLFIYISEDFNLNNQK